MLILSIFVHTFLSLKGDIFHWGTEHHFSQLYLKKDSKKCIPTIENVSVSKKLQINVLTDERDLKVL